MAVRLELSPVTRIEGHLAIQTEAEAVPGSSGKPAYRIVRARCQGEMFRGFENLLQGRDPLDAQQIVQRICGVCPISHGLASIRAQEMAYSVQPTPNGRLLQDLILAANTLQSHILHFYHLAAPDFMDLAHYAEAFEMRRIAHEMAAVFAARMPHSTAIVPGGCTQIPTEERIGSYRSRLGRLAEFIERAFLPDVVAVARAFPQYWAIGAGYGHMLCFGSLDLDGAGRKLLAPGAVVGGKWEPLDPQAIAEDVGFSWFSSPSKLHPARGRTKADAKKAGAYSWLKAPRYKGLPMEVGPLARILVNYHAPHPWPGKPEVDKLLRLLGVGADKLVSVLGRIASRAFETVLVARQAAQWLDQLEPNGPPAKDFKRVKSGSGYGLVEAPRGALGHWLSIEEGKIKHYQCVVPTTWNCSPRDDAGQPGPREKALEGLEVADPDRLVEVGRVVRSFDPCLACAVH